MVQWINSVEAAWSAPGGRRTVADLPLVRKRYVIEVAAATSSGTGEWASVDSGELQGTRAGQSIGDPVSAVDADGDLLIYSLSGEDESSFRIERNTGQLETRVPWITRP